MNFVINTKTFEKLLSNVLTVAPTHSPVEIIQNIKLSVKDNTLIMCATDSQIFIENRANAEADSDFEIIFPGRILYDTVKTVDQTEIKFEVDDSKKLKLLTNTGEFGVSFFDADLFPNVPKLKNPVSFKINGQKLKKAFESTVFATSKEETKIAMTGVLIEMTSEDIRIVATDAHRLIKIAMTDIHNEFPKKIVLPNKAVTSVVKFLTDSEIEVSFDNSIIKFENEGFTFFARLIEEMYPNYESIIPLENNLILEVERLALLKALRRTLLYTSSSTKLVKFNIKTDEMTVYSENIDLGYNAVEKVLCEFNGTQLDIAFNCMFVNEILLNIESEKVKFKMFNSLKACLIEPTVQKDNENILVLVMPLRINSSNVS